VGWGEAKRPARGRRATIAALSDGLHIRPRIAFRGCGHDRARRQLLSSAEATGSVRRWQTLPRCKCCSHHSLCSGGSISHESTGIGSCSFILSIHCSTWSPLRGERGAGPRARLSVVFPNAQTIELNSIALRSATSPSPGRSRSSLPSCAASSYHLTLTISSGFQVWSKNSTALP